MTRKMRYRQVLRHRCANRGKGVYAQQVRLQQSFFREDKSFNLDISKVREIHSSLGTWDMLTEWQRIHHIYGHIETRLLIVHPEGGYRFIYPKVNYNPNKEAQEARWKEQERRTEEFFNSMEV